MKVNESIALNEHWVIHKIKLGGSKKAVFNLGFGDLDMNATTPQIYNSKFQLKKSIKTSRNLFYNE